MLKGRCLCDACQYEVADEFEYAVNCHCSQRRRATQQELHSNNLQASLLENFGFWSRMATSCLIS
ncbi:GFA family protein [Saccharospirillum mangrovi]|uniref:GFA family protein n=1 Tax=Saccharospirillum mangrovi TaxID=2161747 RepID=UPI003F669A26